MEKLSTPELRTVLNEQGVSCKTQNGGYYQRSTMIGMLGGGKKKRDPAMQAALDKLKADNAAKKKKDKADKKRGKEKDDERETQAIKKLAQHRQAQQAGEYSPLDQ